MPFEWQYKMDIMIAPKKGNIGYRFVDFIVAVVVINMLRNKIKMLF